jgi:DNA helicase-2/ATP-dependent DNA helicase PcrA
VLHDWLEQVRDRILEELAEPCTTLDDDWAILTHFIERTGEDDDLAGMTLSQFSGFGGGTDRLNLSTLHSAKGREFDLVVLFGMDDGRIPRYGASEGDVLEARRLFYVGFTRAKREVHIMHTQHNRSPFVTELWERLQEE